MTIAQDYVTKTQAAEILGVSGPTVWRMVKRSELSAEWVGHLILIRREDVMALKRQWSTPAHL